MESAEMLTGGRLHPECCEALKTRLSPIGDKFRQIFATDRVFQVPEAARCVYSSICERKSRCDVFERAGLWSRAGGHTTTKRS